MARVRNMLGLVAAGMILLSAVAHGGLGWPALAGELAPTTAPPDLVGGIMVGWLFGSACMVAFGLILIALFRRRLAGDPVSTWPALVIGVTYIGFGAWALVARDFDPFFLVFIVPGLLLLASATGTGGSH